MTQILVLMLLACSVSCVPIIKRSDVDPYELYYESDNRDDHPVPQTLYESENYDYENHNLPQHDSNVELPSYDLAVDGDPTYVEAVPHVPEDYDNRHNGYLKYDYVPNKQNVFQEYRYTKTSVPIYTTVEVDAVTGTENPESTTVGQNITLDYTSTTTELSITDGTSTASEYSSTQTTESSTTTTGGQSTSTDYSSTETTDGTSTTLGYSSVQTESTTDGTSTTDYSTTTDHSSTMTTEQSTTDGTSTIPQCRSPQTTASTTTDSQITVLDGGTTTVEMTTGEQSTTPACDSMETTAISSTTTESSTEDYDYSGEQDMRSNCKDCSEESKDLDHEMLKKEFLNTIDSKFRSLVFNPVAESHEKFQGCMTPLNETGSCRYVQHCLLPSIVNSVDNFMNYVCVIEERFVGVCCPEYPVSVVTVKWDEPFSINDTAVETPKECGISSKTRIVGGSKADPKDWPWMAALLTMSTGQFYCGGALINNLYVLTAAHCTFRIPKNQILVRLGEYDFSAKEDSQAEDYPVVEIKRHGQYSRRTLKNDIALLKLQRPAAFGKNLGTICLAEKKSYVGQTATLAGWGNTIGGGPSSDVLLEASFPVMDNKNCTEDHGINVPEQFICTKSTGKNKGACNGDSGGPLMHLDEETKHWNSIGVVSWGRRGCSTRFPTVYTSVPEYLDWIEAHAT